MSPDLILLASPTRQESSTFPLPHPTHTLEIRAGMVAPPESSSPRCVIMYRALLSRQTLFIFPREQHMGSKYGRKKEGRWDSVSPAKTQARRQVGQLDIPSPSQSKERITPAVAKRCSRNWHLLCDAPRKEVTIASRPQGICRSTSG